MVGYYKTELELMNERGYGSSTNLNVAKNVEQKRERVDKIRVDGAFFCPQLGAPCTLREVWKKRVHP